MGIATKETHSYGQIATGRLLSPHWRGKCFKTQDKNGSVMPSMVAQKQQAESELIRFLTFVYLYDLQIGPF